MIILEVDLGERSYPILIGEGLLGRADVFDRHVTARDLLIVTNTTVGPLYAPALREALPRRRVVECVLPDGESHKTLSTVARIIDVLVANRFGRDCAVIALGGGVVGDMAGFAAACYQRGVAYVQVPTTLLAQVDSSVGGKTGVNHPLAKNIIGAFHQPELVCYDTATLATLSERDIRAGLSEVIKHGLIWDASFVNWCEEHAEELLALEPEAIAHALYVGCHVKAQVVSQDERESGLRAILNLGHTIGHALEAVAGYNELQHGEAISIGMVGAARLAVRLGYDQEIHTVTKRVIRKFGLPIRLPAHYDREQIMNAMMHDKKFKDGKMVFVVPVAIGQVEIRNDIEADWIRAIIDELKQEA